MSFIDDAKAVATMPVPGGGTPDDQRRMFDALPVAELASLWRALQNIGLRDQTGGIWATALYFDAMPHEQPERALGLVLNIIEMETDIAVLLQLGGKLTTSLAHVHGAALIERLEHEAADNARLRWLLGCSHWWAPTNELKARFAAIADIEGWNAAETAHAERNPPIDFGGLSVAQLAQLWIEQNSLPNKDRDRNFFAMRDFESELRSDDPERALVMICEILKIEANMNMLSFLAAGLLEDLIGMDTIDMVEREAKANDRFKMLLGGVWYHNEPDELKGRLDDILQGAHW